MARTVSVPALLAAAGLLLPILSPALSPALAQTTSQVTRPIEIQIRVKDEAPRCEPTELRVPADANLDLRIENRGTRSVVVRSGDLFKKGSVRSYANSTEEGTDGYSVPGGQNAELLVKSPSAGEYGFSCTEAGGASPQAITLHTVR